MPEYNGLATAYIFLETEIIDLHNFYDNIGKSELDTYRGFLII